MVRAGELLFRPADILNDFDESIISLQAAMVKVAKACGKDNFKPLMANVCLAGGGAPLKGLRVRLQLELDALLQKEIGDFAARAMIVEKSARSDSGFWEGASKCADRHKQPDPKFWTINDAFNLSDDEREEAQASGGQQGAQQEGED